MMIALLIGWEAIGRLLSPVPIAFRQAIPIACLGLAVNIISAWLLSGDHHGHGHGHDHHKHTEAVERIVAGGAVLRLEIYEQGVPPRFRITPEDGRIISAADLSIETVRPDGSRQMFAFVERVGMLESIEEIPEPHAFIAHLALAGHNGETATATARFAEPAHVDAAAHRDNNMRAAIVHVMADAAVSVLVIVGLMLARAFGWRWMDPLAGLIGAGVIVSWAYGLVCDTGGILLDMNPDRQLTETLRQDIEADGDRLMDLHVWRLGPGHLGAVLSVVTRTNRRPEDYLSRLQRFPSLSHVTVEVRTEAVTPTR
jgi:cation diffusion facilitator family transporter